MYNNLNIRLFATRRSKKLLSLVVFVCLYLCSFSQAKLLNPNGSGDDHWKGSNSLAKKYLKARISYLCPASIAGQLEGNSKFMRSFQRISKIDGEDIIASGDYVRKTCLSESYHKDWIDGAETNYINPTYPDIVYAFSRGNDIDGFDVYYWVSDDLSPEPSNNDDDIRPLLSGDARQLFQQGNGGGYTSHLISLDLSGWNFREVTNLEQFLSGNFIMTDVTFGTTVDLMKVTNISNMFDPAKDKNGKDTHYSLSADKFSELISTFVIDDSKLTNRNAKAKDYSGMFVTTANEITYEISPSGSFDKRLDGTTTMKIRNLDAIQDGRTIDFTWDVVFETNVRSYTVECIDEDDIWDNETDLLTVDECDLIKENVKLYRPSYTVTDIDDYEGAIKQYRLRILYTDGTIGHSDPFDLMCENLLPIELISFEYNTTEDKFVWETASETNNHFFTIEQSIEGGSFHEVAQIDGAGTSSTSNFYEYSMPAAFSGLMYFRLKQTDYNGDYSYSDVQTIFVDNGEYIRLYPTIATDFITIEGDYESVKFSNEQGKIHHPTRMHGNSYPIAALPQGMHYAIISLKNGEIVTRQFFRK